MFENGVEVSLIPIIAPRVYCFGLKVKGFVVSYILS